MAAVAAVAVAISAVAAVAYLAVTGLSIRDLYKSCKQVIQVKEEGLVTVQSLQPVLTPITPIAGKTGCDEIGDAVGAKIAKAQVGGLAVGVVALAGAIVAQAAAVAVVAVAWPVAAGLAAVAGTLAIGGLVALGAAEAYVYKRKTAQKAAKAAALELAKGGLVLGAKSVGGAKIAKGGVVTGEVAELVAGALAAPGKEAVEAAAQAAKAAGEVAKDSVRVGVKIAKGTTAAGAVGGLVLGAAAGNVAETVGAAALDSVKAAAGSIASWGADGAGNAAQGVASWAGKVAAIMALGQGGEILGLLTGAAGGAIVGVAIAGAVAAAGLVIAGGALIAPDWEPEQSTSKPPKQEKCQGVEIANEEDWVPVAKVGVKAAAVTIGTDAKGSAKVGAKVVVGVEIAQKAGGAANSDVMKSLAGEKDFLEAAGDLYQAIASAQDWEPVVGKATVAQSSRAR